MTILSAFLIGLFAGLRSLTAPAVTAWAAYLGWLTLERPLSAIGSLPAVAILTLLAVAELIADKLPQTPNRTAPPGLIARIVTGGLTGACIAAGRGQRISLGALLGVAGAITGCFAGYRIRGSLVRKHHFQDIYIALVEDVIAIAGCLWVVLW
ncbi:MAG TPA: DUF4126 family protein [Terriglobales bacterium]|jgi:uncharacterized membrane protein|nr:DUF4126 family protein [Terriglobales bacterium]